jgi:hypothetical protein
MLTVVFLSMLLPLVGFTLVAVIAFLIAVLRELRTDKYAVLSAEFAALEGEDECDDPVPSEESRRYVADFVSSEAPCRAVHSRLPNVPATRKRKVLSMIKLFKIEVVKDMRGESVRQQRFIAIARLRCGRVFMEPIDGKRYEEFMTSEMHEQMLYEPQDFFYGLMDEYPQHTYGAACGNVFAVPHYGEVENQRSTA